MSKQSKAPQNMGAGYAFLPIKQVDFWPSGVESGVRVKCDVGYLCANISLSRYGMAYGMVY